LKKQKRNIKEKIKKRERERKSTWVAAHWPPQAAHGVRHVHGNASVERRFAEGVRSWAWAIYVSSASLFVEKKRANFPARYVPFPLHVRASTSYVCPPIKVRPASAAFFFFFVSSFPVLFSVSLFVFYLFYSFSKYLFLFVIFLYFFIFLFFIYFYSEQR
jgi:hypothetical protein